jgi:hypothetical protein
MDDSTLDPIMEFQSWHLKTIKQKYIVKFVADAWAIFKACGVTTQMRSNANANYQNT